MTPATHYVAKLTEATMWDILMIAYWACVAMPVVVLCAGVVTAFREVAARPSNAGN